MEQPVYTIENNVFGTENVLKSCLAYGCKLLLASTSEIYGKSKVFPQCEVHDMILGQTKKNRWSYAASKIIDEFLTLAYYEEYGLQATILRLFNTIGPKQIGHYGMVVPTFMFQALKGEPITVFGDGTQTRCFCNVYDTVDAIYLLSHNSNTGGQIYNIGSQEEISIIELAKKVKTISKSRSEIIFVPFSDVYKSGFEDMERRVPDTNKIYKMLGWETKISLNQTLVQVKNWIENK
ncbi:Bifunctional polymyxin resistance protein ArnA [subsurface metagenome]